MLGWLGSLCGASAAFIGGFYTGGLTWKLIPICLAGLGVGGTAGYVGDRLLDSHKKQIENSDKQTAADLAQAKTDSERIKVAETALNHHQNLLTRISENLAKKESRNEELKEIIEGKKELPANTTMEEVKDEYKDNQKESAELVRQLNNGRTTIDSLTSIIQGGGKNWDWPNLTAKNIGWGIGLIIISLVLIGVVTRALRNWLGMLI